MAAIRDESFQGEFQFMADAEKKQQYDVVLLGGGTGGYWAAIRARQLGMSVAVIEEYKLGGVCLHKGCIPTKAMLKSASVFDLTKNAAEYGVEFKGEATFNYGTAMGRSKKIVDGQYKGLQYLFDKKHKIDTFIGRGKLTAKDTVEVTLNEDGKKISLKGTYIILNTGSRPRAIDGIEFDGKRVINSDHAVELENMPKSIIVRGGGATGVEWASVYHRYGAKVTLVGRVVPNEDPEISQQLTRAFQRQKIALITDVRPTKDDFEISDKGVRMTVTDKKGKEQVVDAETLLVATGRQANIEDIGLEEVGVKTENGFVAVDSMMRTNVENIYAIGDVNGQQMLAHTAQHHALIAVEYFANLNPFPLDVLNSPTCTYCEPEIGSVGLNERTAKDLGYEIKVGKFPMRPNAKAVIEGEPDGFTKVIVDADTNDVLGVHIIGVHATELIAEAGLARFLNSSVEELFMTVHPHPTVSEVIGQAAMDAVGEAIDM